ncbi:unnamed protein product [Vitrella brassicaformis CCMP3155]|uniref:Uncharacterized protein n=1 Tax=Vitrella brassicaformis (strain CCMP3155) TaxID=1169540 RepID=A0A0G4FGL0_VITBC|nr:unnamed protein product [Vitrella brassicaformis CCMP3155]|eukprot:CEM11988.1 unnamed protein product [Vitrella brassicaformis CCMP3155]
MPLRHSPEVGGERRNTNSNRRPNRNGKDAAHAMDRSFVPFVVSLAEDCSNRIVTRVCLEHEWLRKVRQHQHRCFRQQCISLGVAPLKWHVFLRKAG